MNLRTPTLIAITAAFSLTALSAQAAMPAKKGHGDHGAVHAKVDANGDGKISVEEMVAYRTKAAKEMAHKADKNGDGYISKEEMKAAHSKRKDKRHEWKEKHKEKHDEKRSGWKEKKKEKRDAWKDEKREKRAGKWEKAPKDSK